MTFASVYPMYFAKVEKKGRTMAELDQVIEWLTSFDRTKLEELIRERVTFATFFERASLNPNAHLITGVICGYRVDEIENTLTQQVRYVDKLVDELATGRKMEKILRSAWGDETLHESMRAQPLPCNKRRHQHQYHCRQSGAVLAAGCVQPCGTDHDDHQAQRSHWDQPWLDTRPARNGDSDCRRDFSDTKK